MSRYAGRLPLSRVAFSWLGAHHLASEDHSAMKRRRLLAGLMSAASLAALSAVARLAAPASADGGTGRVTPTSSRRTSSSTMSWGKKTSKHNRRADVCHEVGHAIGLDHVKKTASCMNPIIADNHADKPDAADYKRINAM